MTMIGHVNEETVKEYILHYVRQRNQRTKKRTLSPALSGKSNNDLQHPALAGHVYSPYRATYKPPREAVVADFVKRFLFLCNSRRNLRLFRQRELVLN